MIGLAFDDIKKENFSMELTEKIRQLGTNRFGEDSVERFLERFNHLLSGSKIIASILQISTDQGEELECGFFTSDAIVDITLSNGQIYSYSYPLSKVKDVHLIDKGSKWVLTITGEKKFDYNVVKPGATHQLKEYEFHLRQYLGLFE